MVTARIRRKIGAISQKSGVINSHIHWYQIPEAPLRKTLEVTLTAWS